MGFAYNVGGADTLAASATIPVCYLSQKTAVIGRLALGHLRICSAAVTPGGDYQAVYQVQRMTAENGTPGGSQVTPHGVDPAAPATNVRLRENLTNGPTLTAGAFGISYLGGNVRSQVVWTPREEKHKVIVPATIEHGIALMCQGVSTAFDAKSDWTFEEGY